jgi:hypothetical protein
MQLIPTYFITPSMQFQQNRTLMNQAVPYTYTYIIPYLYLLQLSSWRWALGFETGTCSEYCEKKM